MKGKFSKFVVIVLVILTIGFTSTVLYLMSEGMDEPDTLIRYWFTGFVSEMLALAGIKVTKIVKSHRSYDEDEEEAVG